MGPLASLLPGLRDVRAPLAAGYLCLLDVWLVYGDSISRHSEAQGLIEKLSRLESTLSDLGVGIALSFVAYLVGTLIEWGSTTVLNVTPSSSAASYEGRVVKTVKAHRERQLQNGVDGRRESPKSYPFSRRSEFGAIRTVLMVEQPLLYNEYDRFKSEAEFRFAPLFPLGWLTNIIATNYGGPFLLGLGAIFALGFQAVQFQRQSDATLIQSVMSNKVKSPYLEHHGVDVENLEWSAID